MSCINLKDWESRALLAGASALVRPVKPEVPRDFLELCAPLSDDPAPWQQDWHIRFGPQLELRLNGSARRVFVQEDGPDRGVWARFYRPNNSSFCVWRRFPATPGSTLIGREAWGYDENGFYWYKAGAKSVPPSGWLSPVVMPARKARHRYPVVSVEARELPKVSEETWIAAGIKPESYAGYVAERVWLATYHSGSWSGWVWVIHLGR